MKVSAQIMSWNGITACKWKYPNDTLLFLRQFFPFTRLKKFPKALPCFVVFPSFSDTFPAVFLVLYLFICPSLFEKKTFNFPAA